MRTTIARLTGQATRILLTLGVLAAGAGWSAQAIAQTAPNGNDHGQSIVGTWRVTVTLRNCETGVPVGPPFPSYLTFGPGGTLVETTANAAFLPGQRSPGHGAWSHAGGEEYKAASEAFILFDSVATPPAPSFQRGVQRLSQAITLHKDDTLDSVAVIQFFDTQGHLGKSGCATAEGRRFK